LAALLFRHFDFWTGAEEITMIDADGGSSPFNRPAPRLRDPDTDDLDRLAASLHYLMLFGREPSPDEASDHVAFEPMSDHKQFSQ